VTKQIWQKTYHGFEDFSDYWRDVDEAVNPDFNAVMKEIPAEFQGKITVTITYESEVPHEQ
jgi:hypothetical protein